MAASMTATATCPSQLHSFAAPRLSRSLTCDCEEILAGLSAEFPRIDPKYFYDELGSRLFDQICDLDEYYPTRTEQSIMDDSMPHIVSSIGSRGRLIEYGSGSSRKTRSLLRALPPAIRYTPIDISKQHLHRTAESLRDEFPEREIQPVVADFSKPFDLGATIDDDNRRILYFPGSTIGNFEPDAAENLLRRMREQSGDDGGLLIGFDLQKDRQTLINAYDDAAGVTAAFNRNVLCHLNRLVGSNFDPDAFDHRVEYNEDHHRIEMSLRCSEEQRVTIGDHRLRFEDGDRIRTEYSHKYTVDGFAGVAERCRWRVQDVWTDSRRFFAVAFFAAA